MWEFQEGNIHFAPTYKIAKGKDAYNLSRIPGWTDRIIFRCKENRLKQKSYDSNNEFKISDHRPVFAQFEMLFDFQRDFRISSKKIIQNKKVELSLKGKAF